MNARTLRDAMRSDTTASRHHQQCTGARKSHTPHSAERTSPVKGDQGLTVERIVSEWRRVYRNLYDF